MKETLLDKRKLGEKMSVGCELDLESGEIGFYIASADVSAAIAFRPNEWRVFVAAVNEAERLLIERRK